MTSQQRAQIALNLSYVLHERSDSDTVQQYVRAQEAERRRSSKAIRELSRLSNSELSGRMVVLDQSASIDVRAAVDYVVTMNLGAIELLPRLLQIAGLWPPRTESIPAMLDNVQSGDVQTHTFFGAPACLNTPTAPSDSHERILFATAVLRPGNVSILLRATSVYVGGGSGAADWRDAVRLAEQAIREFPLQWWCDRPLWSRPVEETLPEFRSTGNGTIACGH